ncbi:MAG TPA: helix-turn-helix domain-containing protein, partial [Myxococcaceae bacterium]
NVRELENAIERSVLLAEGNLVQVQNLPERIWSTSSRPPEGEPRAADPGQGDLSLKRAMRSLEERYIRAALRRTKGNRTRASELLEISHRALLYKIKEYGIDADAEGELG